MSIKSGEKRGKIFMCPFCRLPRPQKNKKSVVVSFCARCGAKMEEVCDG